jgi:hypothetical protein
MATTTVFEKTHVSKVMLDDTVPLTAFIEAAQKKDDHMVSKKEKENLMYSCNVLILIISHGYGIDRETGFATC